MRDGLPENGGRRSNIVDVYIPWFIHEPEEGIVDFDSLRKFLELALRIETAS